MGVWLLLVRLWVGGIRYFCSGYYGVKGRQVFGLCVFGLTVSCVFFFMVRG